MKLQLPPKSTYDTWYLDFAYPCTDAAAVLLCPMWSRSSSLEGMTVAGDRAFAAHRELRSVMRYPANRHMIMTLNPYLVRTYGCWLVVYVAGAVRT